MTNMIPNLVSNNNKNSRIFKGPFHLNSSTFKSTILAYHN